MIIENVFQYPDNLAISGFRFLFLPAERPRKSTRHTEVIPGGRAFESGVQ
jgi:hypothetical protein